MKTKLLFFLIAMFFSCTHTFAISFEDFMSKIRWTDTDKQILSKYKANFIEKHDDPGDGLEWRYIVKDIDLDGIKCNTRLVVSKSTKQISRLNFDFDDRDNKMIYIDIVESKFNKIYNMPIDTKTIHRDGLVIKKTKWYIKDNISAMIVKTKYESDDEYTFCFFAIGNIGKYYSDWK